MTKISLDKLNHKELIELQGEIADALARRRNDEMSELRRKMAALAGEAGFQLDEVFGTRRATGKRGAAVVKFRNPKNPAQTWTGRGRKPTWIVEALKKGAKIESFAI